MAKSNKQRQQEYRDRKRKARNASVTPPIGAKEGVTQEGHSRDYIGIDGFNRMYIGEGKAGPLYALVRPAVRLADPPDPDDTWSPIAYGTEKPPEDMSQGEGKENGGA